MLRSFWQTRKRPLVFLTVTLALALWVTVFIRQNRLGQVQRHLDAGIEYVHVGQPRDAEREWQEAARMAPDNVTIWELLSGLYINTEQWSKGTDALQHLLRIAPNRPYLYSRLAACALRTGNEQEAQRLALEELKRNPGDAASLTIMAFLSSMQDNSEQQITYLQRLLARHPNSPETLHDLTQAYHDASKFTDLLPLVDRLLTIKPDDGYALSLRGSARYEVDASPAAAAQSEADLLRALQINPLSAFARYTLGRVYLREGQFRKAIFQLELAQKLYPRKMDVPFELATAYARIGQPAKATTARQRFETLRQESTQMSVLQKRCALDKHDFAAHLQLGELMLKNGNERQALYYLQRALVLNPNSAEAKSAYKQLLEQLKGHAPDLPH